MSKRSPIERRAARLVRCYPRAWRERYGQEFAQLLIDEDAERPHNFPAGGDLIPGAIARVCWAATLWITTYWAHSHALAKFPSSEVVWMFVSPSLLVALVASARMVARGLEISSRSLRFESWMAVAAGIAMVVFLAGTAAWLAAGTSAPPAMFRTGAIDAGGAALMGAALIVACRAVLRVLSAPRAPTAGGSDA